MFVLDVPIPVREAAAAALKVHRQLPRTGEVRGVSIADALASGSVTLDVVQKMDRFFTAHARRYADESQRLLTPAESATIRAWGLYGGDAGVQWARTAHESLRQRGLVADDPVLELFSLRPEEVYDRFSLGAWRYEYDFDPRSAARFVDEYTRATGFPLELSKAFGSAAPAVGNALYRRTYSPNPFELAYKAAMRKEYAQAALEDVQTLPGDYVALDESLPRKVFTTMRARQASLLAWPVVFAYFVLASEAPEMLVRLNRGSHRPPSIYDKLEPYTKYIDPINLCSAYFHPEGARYRDPDEYTEGAYAVDNDVDVDLDAGDSSDAAVVWPFAGLDGQVMDALYAAWRGLTLTRVAVLKLFAVAERWLQINKFSGPTYHLLRVAWQSRDWPVLLEHIPLDADVRPVFVRFVENHTV
jgi:hypothetical protein